MNKAKLLEFIEKIQKYWKTAALQVSLMATLIFYLIPYFFPSFQIDPKWIFSSIYLGVLSIAFILLDIYESILQKKDITAYVNMKAAEPIILKTIETVCKKKRSSPIEIKILGNRLSRIAPLISDIFRMSNDGKYGQNAINFKIYHTDPSALLHQDYLPLLDKKRIIEYKRKSHSDNLLSNIEWLTQEAESVSNVSIKFVKSSPIPYFYAYLIDQQHLFWGYFFWDENISDWIGPSNKCYYINTKDDPTEFIGWLVNRLKIYDIVFDK